MFIRSPQWPPRSEATPTIAQVPAPELAGWTLAGQNPENEDTGKRFSGKRAWMNSTFARMWLAPVALLIPVGAALGQPSPDWPDWAYGLLEPLSEESRLAPTCPGDAHAIECAFIGPPPPEDGVKRTLPGTERSFTRNEAYYNYGPADWYPNDHPPMPDVVAHGKEHLGVRACALCHYPNGQGKMENGHVAGLPEGYILQQLQAFAEGNRHSADPRKANTNEMARIAASLTDDEKRQIAAYYSSIPYKKMIRVEEATLAPQVRTTSNGLMLPMHDLPLEPLGQRIIEVPEDPERTELNRDPRGTWITYVPARSLASGQSLVVSGRGKTIPCRYCHGPQHTGLGDIPSIAGRTASYTMRQLWDFKQETRQSAVMRQVVDQLTAEDMMYIAAYLASLEP